MFLYRVCDALTAAGIRYAIAGGYAVALHGAVRGTVDIDLVLRLQERDFTRAEAALVALGLRPRLPVTAAEVFRFRDEYIRNRNLLAWSFANPSNPAEIVDILIAEDLAKCKVVKVRAGGRELPVLSRKDLGAESMKAVQHFTDEQLRYGRSLTPDQVVQFLEDFRLLHAGRALAQGKSTQVNVRVPQALLRAFRARAEALGVPYQAQIKRLMEAWVSG